MFSALRSRGTGFVVGLAIVALVAGTFIGRFTSGLGMGALGDIAAQHGLTADEAAGVLRSAVPPGKYDEYVMVASGARSLMTLID